MHPASQYCSRLCGVVRGQGHRFGILCLLLVFTAGIAASYPATARAQATTAPPEAASYVVEGEQSRTRLTFYRPDVVRVDWQRRGDGTGFAGAPDTSLAVIRTPGEGAEMPAVQVHERPDGVQLLRTERLTVEIHQDPLRLHFFDGEGQSLVSGTPAGGFTTRDTAQVLRFAIEPETHFYGTGERGGTLNLRGRAFRSYNTQQYGYTEAPPVMKINVPLLTTSGDYALFFDSPWPGHFDVGAARANRLQYTAANRGEPARGSLSYYLIAGETPREQLEGYTWLTGRQPLPPRWGLGYIQSKYGYRSAEAARGVVDTLLQKNIPVSALVVDLYWFEHMGDLAWNRDGGWPDPMALARHLEDEGVKLITITEPYLQARSALYDEALAKGYVGEHPDGSPYVMEDWWSCTAGAAFASEARARACDVALLDITDPDAQAWWWRQYPEFMQDEVDGFWTDLGEPERHPRDMQHDLGPTPRIHNVYNLLWAKTLYEGFDRWRPNRRIFNLTRSGYAGIQRYGTFLWSGDVRRSFTTLEAQLPLLLNAGLSGLGYYSSDLGGFTGDFYSPELYARWLQMGAFTPTMRVHGQDDLPTEPWGFDAEVEDIARRYIRLRYRMLPYNYTLARQNHDQGTPLARPVFFAEAESEKLLTYDDAFLWGDALLVAPVTREGQRTKEVYLPRGIWTDYWTGRVYEGRQTVEVEAPLARLPLFARAGSIIPMRASPRPTDAPFDTLALDIFPREEAAAHFTLYEDDGISQEYRQGAYAKTHLVQEWAGEEGKGRTLRLRIGPAAGAYGELPDVRLWRADVRRMAEAPAAVRFDGQLLQRHPSRAALYRTGRGYYYDAGAQRLVVQHRGTTDRAHQLTAQGVELAP